MKASASSRPAPAVVFGIHPVAEAIRAGRVSRIFAGPRRDARVAAVVAEAESLGVPVVWTDLATLERDSRGGRHQGVVAQLVERPAIGVADLVRHAGEPALLVVLDGIVDPQNVGAILRTADAAGCHGVVRQRRRAAPLGAAVARASAGASAHVKVAEVVNIARALEELKALGVWTVGLAVEAGRAYDEVDLTLPVAIVLGAEGTGLRRLVRETCDWLVRIPMFGRVGSLNVSVAAGVVLFEARRQRCAGKENRGPHPSEGSTRWA